MSRVIFFGDSYTKGHGCLPGYEYYSMKRPHKLWIDLIAEKLNYEKVDYSDTGKSNEDIISNLISFLKGLQSNDIVIVGTTSPTRTHFFLDNKPLNFSGRKAGMTYSQLVKEQQNRLPLAYTEELHSSLSSYVLDVKVPFYNNWDEYYTNIYKSLETIFPKNILIWSYQVWFNFESITEDTQGKLKDSHWSWNGHYQFYNYLIPIINERFFS